MDELDRIFAWNDALDDSSYYEILGVLEIADDEAIGRAFRALSLAFHPDVHVGADSRVRAIVERIFQRGVEAHRVLSDPELRLRYDVALRKGQLRLDERASRRSAPSSPAKPLDAICRSAGAKLCAQRAGKLLVAGDFRAAKTELERALDYDGGANPELVQRIADLELALYAGGDAP
jgi:curved DNA-binding protein CbpA